jgi:hypothetical protein
METAEILTRSNASRTSAYDLVVAPVESFCGAVVAGDALLTLAWRLEGMSRLGRSVFLRDEIDAGVVHALTWGRRGDLLPIARGMTRAVGLGLIEHPSDVGAVSPDGAVAILSVEPSEVERLIQDAPLQGFTVSQIGLASALTVSGRRSA